MRLMPLTILLAVACAPVSEPESSTAFGFDEGPLEIEAQTPAEPGARRSTPVLTVEGTPYYGQSITLRVTGADPGETVYYAYSLAASGSPPCYAALGGLCLDINDPVSQITSLVADGTGSTAHVHTLPPSGPAGLNAWLQVAIPAGAASSKSNVVPITVDYDNTAPTAVNDTYNTDEDVAVVADPLANDPPDPDGDTVAVVPVSLPSNGGLVDNLDGTFTYIPDPNWSGTDQMTYQTDDGLAQSNIATITFQVAAVNDAPIGSSDTYNSGVIEDTVFVTPVGEEVLVDDFDIEGHAMTAFVSTQPTDGGSVVMQPDGSFTYTPFPDFDGTAYFGYQIQDALGAVSNEVQVTLIVGSRNDPPAPVPDFYSTPRDTVLNVPAPGPLSNDIDVDGPFPLTMTSAPGGEPDLGAVALNSDGSFTYTPSLCYVGPDTFSYRAVDGVGRFTKSDVTVDVGAGAPLDPAYCDAYDQVSTPNLAGTVHTTVHSDPAWFIVPPSPVALVLMYHGGGGGNTAYNMQSFSQDILADELVSRGYALAAMSSVRRFPSDWDTSTTNRNNNDDWPYIDGFRDTLIATTDVTAATPVVMLGQSAGGWFVPIVTEMAQADGWDVMAMVMHVAAPTSTPNGVPAFFYSGDNDDGVPPGDVQSAYNSHVGPKQLYNHTEIVMHHMYWRRHVEYTHQDSVDHFNELVRLGGIDGAGNRLVDLADLQTFSAMYEANSTAKQPGRVTTNLKPAWAGHAFHDYATIAEADFLDSHL